MKTFDELFENALRYETIETPTNDAHRAAIKNYYECVFYDWLHQTKGYEYGNEKQYSALMTKKNWKDFLTDLKAQRFIAREQHEREKASWNETESEESKVYYIKGGKQVTSDYDFLNETGTLERLKKDGFGFIPTHNFTLLKEQRQSAHKEAELKFSEKQKLNGVSTTELDKNLFYVSWLKGELEGVKRWMSDKFPNGDVKAIAPITVQIEILKYQAYVNDEMTRVEKLINPPEPTQVNSIQNPLDNYNKLKWDTEEFQGNVLGCLTDPVKLREFSRPYTDLFDVSHRATIEVANLVFTNNQGAERLIKSIKIDTDKIIAEDLRIRNKFNMGNAKVFLQVRPYFVVMQAFFDFYNFLVERQILEPIQTGNEAKQNPKRTSAEFNNLKVATFQKTNSPTFKAELIEEIFDHLKDFFDEKQREDFKQLLKCPTEKKGVLAFLDSGNRLADAFKQLINVDAITGCEKRELELWITENFSYVYRRETKQFTKRYLNDIISTNKDKCSRPILNAKIDKGTNKISVTKA